MTAKDRIRPPAVAGQFYPSGPAELEGGVERMLGGVDVDVGIDPVRVVLSPHAGYPYSGRVAAHGFRAAAECEPGTVVLIGPSHFEYFDFTSIYDGDGYATPLGVVPVDRALAERLCKGGRTLCASDRGHAQRGARGEHSLEVQLPFLQKTFPRASIVPVIMGDQGWDYCRELGDALADVATDDVLILASTDLSHFYDASRADALDGAFNDVASTLGAREVYDAVAARRCEACGAGAVVASLLAIEGRAGAAYHLLERTHSGAVTGDNTSVVGYLSATVTACSPS